MILVFGGALLILALDWNHAPSLGSLNRRQKVMAAFFQSVTTRTAALRRSRRLISQTALQW